MAMTTCPNCGKQLRPGARFCGSCGATLPAGSAGKSLGAAGPASAQPPADTLPCPNCGKPVRKGAKFCGQCGYVIAPESAAAPSSPGADPTLASASTHPGAQAGPIRPADRRTSALKPAAAPPPATAAASPHRGLPLLLLAALAVVCLAVVGGGYFVAARQGWLGGVLGGALGTQPSSTEALSVIVTETAFPPVSPTRLESPTDVPTPEPMLTPTDVPAPTQEPTLAVIEPSLPLPSPTTASSTALTGLPPTTTATVTTTVPISGIAPTIELVLDDVFDGPVSANWLAWGDPRPTVDSGPGYKWLSLKADDPGAAGVTTRTGVVVVNAPGLEIEFTAAIQDRYPNSKLYMDWDPQQTRRGPELKDPGLIRVGVSKDKATLSTMLTRQSCFSAVDGLLQHRYVVRVIEGYRVELYLDDSSTPACTIESLGLEATVPGRVSFTGRGWLTHVKIMQPVVEP